MKTRSAGEATLDYVGGRSVEGEGERSARLSRRSASQLTRRYFSFRAGAQEPPKIGAPDTETLFEACPWAIATRFQEACRKHNRLLEAWGPLFRQRSGGPGLTVTWDGF